MQPGKFYVYLLKDPRTQKPFYVGKGSKKRAYTHLKPQRGENQRKAERIAEIRQCGQEPIVEIVCHYENEFDAYEHERELIALHDGLTNILAGFGWLLTREEAERRANERKARACTQEKIATMNTLRRYVKLWDTFPNGVTCTGVKNPDAVAGEIVSIIRTMVADFDAAPNI